MQNVQKRSQPSITVTKARPGRLAAYAGVALGQVEARGVADLLGRGAPLPASAAAKSSGTRRTLWVPNTKSSCGKRRSSASPSCCATQPPDAEQAARRLALPGPQQAEVGVQPVLGLLAHRAGVDQDQVGARPRRAGRQSAWWSRFATFSVSCWFIWQP